MAARVRSPAPRGDPRRVVAHIDVNLRRRPVLPASLGPPPECFRIEEWKPVNREDTDDNRQS